MTKVSPELGSMGSQEVLAVSADVSFASDCFPKYKLGPDNQILEEPKDDNKGPSLKEVVERETAQLSEQHKRLSVRDLASKFDKNLAAAAKLSNEAKLREVASLEGHVLLKKLRDALESLRGRLSGQNKEDVEKAIAMVEALAVKLTQKEGELIQEKFEVKKLVNFLKQASEDAKKLVSQENSFACAEIESARAVVQRFGEALEEEERNSQTSKKQDVEELLQEVQEARRIKLLHQPSKVMGMEHELRALRLQIREKSIFSFKLQKELTMSKRAEENRSRLYILEGCEALGSNLRVRPCADNAPVLCKCSIQWFRLSSDGSQRDAISGAISPSYAPEPLDVGRILEVEIISNGNKDSVATIGPIDPVSGLESHVETLMRKSNAEFTVTISQVNGQDHQSHSSHTFHVGKTRVKLCRGWITKARDIYSASMQLCGVRSDSSVAAKGLFWQPRKGSSFVLTFESERDRNAAIMLARKYALDCNHVLKRLRADLNTLRFRGYSQLLGEEKDTRVARGDGSGEDRLRVILGYRGQGWLLPSRLGLNNPTRAGSESLKKSVMALVTLMESTLLGRPVFRTMPSNQLADPVPLVGRLCLVDQMIISEAPPH